MSSIDTRQRVRVTTNHPQALGRAADGVGIVPVVLVDGEPLVGVTRVELDAPHDAPAKVRVTLIGVDVDLEGAPEYLVKVVGPEPSR